MKRIAIQRCQRITTEQLGDLKLSRVSREVCLCVGRIRVTGLRVDRLLQLRREPDRRFVVADFEAVGAEAGCLCIRRVGYRNPHVSIYGRLAMLGADNDQRRLIQMLSS